MCSACRRAEPLTTQTVALFPSKHDARARPNPSPLWSSRQPPPAVRADLLDQDCCRRAPEKRRGPLRRCLLSDKPVGGGFSKLVHLSEGQVCPGSAYTPEAGSRLPGRRCVPSGMEAFINLNNNLRPPRAHRRDEQAACCIAAEDPEPALPPGLCCYTFSGGPGRSWYGCGSGSKENRGGSRSPPRALAGLAGHG